MASYSRHKKKRIRYRLSPKDADEIIRQEFTDKRGNRFINRIIFKPQNPLKSDYTQTVEYKDNK